MKNLFNSVFDPREVIDQVSAMTAQKSESLKCHKESKLLPKNESSDYWIHQQWIYYVLTNIEPHTGRVFGCDHLFEQNEKTAFARKLDADILGRMLARLNEMFMHKKYLMGDEFQLVDLLLVSSLFYVRHTDILKNYSDLKRHTKDCECRPVLGLVEGLQESQSDFHWVR